MTNDEQILKLRSSLRELAEIVRATPVLPALAPRSIRVAESLDIVSNEASGEVIKLLIAELGGI